MNLKKTSLVRSNLFLSFIVFALMGCPSLLWGAEEDKAETQFNYATTYWDSGDLYSARQEYQKLVDLYPDSSRAPEALFRIGDSSTRLYDFARALRAYGRIISDFPDLDITASAHLRLGNHYRDSQDYDQARHHYGRILDNYSHTRESTVARRELIEISERLAEGEGSGPAREEQTPRRSEQDPTQDQEDLSTPSAPDDGDTIATGAR